MTSTGKAMESHSLERPLARPRAEQACVPHTEVFTGMGSPVITGRRGGRQQQPPVPSLNRDSGALMEVGGSADGVPPDNGAPSHPSIWRHNLGMFYTSWKSWNGEARCVKRWTAPLALGELNLPSPHSGAGGSSCSREPESQCLTPAHLTATQGLTRQAGPQEHEAPSAPGGEELWVGMTSWL